MNRDDLLSQRMSGVLMHPTSLAGGGACGTLGPEAEALLSFLKRTRQRCWQTLPISPTPGNGSPYSALSAFAGNTWLIAHEPLVAAGWIEHGGSFAGVPSGDHCDFAAAAHRADRLIEAARGGFEARAGSADRADFEAFREREAGWLEDYALYKALRNEYGERNWTDWPHELARREPAAVAAAREHLGLAVAHEVFGQYLVDRQWRDLRRQAEEAGIYLIGDIPIYVSHDSADVWARQDLFELDPSGQPERVAGVPPDYFSATGQRWGNPIYRWDVMAEHGYAWWSDRFRRLFSQFDIVRIDHFRGFEAYWSIPASEPTAVNGEWVKGPGEDIFHAVAKTLGKPLEVIAEDLGVITDEVRALRDRLGFPGMAILQFAFYGDPNHPYLPENARERQVTYPGTHDNDTTCGWYDKLSEQDRRHVEEYFDGPLDDPAWTLIEVAWRSRANLAIAQVQDLLSLGTEARLNVPGLADGNWTWRLSDRGRLEGVAERLARLTEEAGRT